VREPFALQKVLYDPREQDALIDGAIRTIEDEFLDLAFEQEGDTLARVGGTASHLCATSVRALAVRIKHPSFEEEDEWRLTTMNITGHHIANAGVPLVVRYRACDGRIVPYMAARYEDGLPVSELVVGYGLDFAAATGALGVLFRDQQIEPPPKVFRSAVPVR
jgi:hypothetical protein